jgi:hypothetical protein
MRCKILRDFAFSTDGYTSQPATKGWVVDIPGNLVAGLEAAGYLTRETKDAGAAPENKMLKAPAPENKLRKNSGRR